MTGTERDNDMLYRLWCVMVMGAGSRIINQLLELYGDDPGKVYMALAQDETVREELGAKITGNADRVRLSDAEALAERCRRKNINIVTSRDRAYPERFRTVFAPPQVLFCKGDISKINTINTAGIVGCRKPSEYSRQVTDAAVTALVKRGTGIVSGFAEGIDISAALTAIRRGGLTYAVLGCGADVDYPKPNRRYREMIVSNGAIITEYLPDCPPHPWNFPQRNRLIAGLSDFIAVMEASAESGALNTATHACEMSKTVFVTVPADLFDKRYMGQAILIRDGATPFMGIRDFDSFYSGESADTDEAEDDTQKSAPPKADVPKPRKKADKDKSKDTRPKDQKDRKQEKEAKKPSQQKALTPKPVFEKGSLHGRIAEALAGDGLSLMELADRLSCETDELLFVLTEMEIDGHIENNGTKYRMSGENRSEQEL